MNLFAHRAIIDGKELPEVEQLNGAELTFHEYVYYLAVRGRRRMLAALAARRTPKAGRIPERTVRKR